VVSDFDEFVRVRSARLLRTAYLLTQDHALAEDLLQTALARCWPAWSRMEADPEPYVRRVLVNTYNSWWRRRWNAERPVSAFPDVAVPSPQSNVDERDEVWRAISRLPRQQRAVIVLRYFEDLSEAQIAEVMSISTGSVKHYASKGLAKLRTDPSLLAIPEQAPPGTERVAAVQERIRTRRQARIAATVFAVVAVLVVAVLLFPLRNRHSEPVTPPSPSPSADYYDGKKTVATLPWTRISQEGTTFTWTPSSLAPISLQPLCVVETDRDVDLYMVVISVATEWFGLGCQHGSEPPAGLNHHLGETITTETLIAAGIKAGVPVTVTVHIQDPQNRIIAPPGWYAALIGEHVPFADYPLPSPPAVLPSILPKPKAYPWQERLSADGPHSVTIVWRSDLTVWGYAQTPGHLRIVINGVRVTGPAIRFWTYSENAYEEQAANYVWPPGIAKPAQGTLVTVTIESEMLRGYWYADVLSS
jgi:RNA polymerase sigma-70 factor (sigma-E family)